MTAKLRRQCQATVYRRDCLRRTGRGRYGFEMHFTRCQCRRKARSSGYCWQHEARTR